MSPIAAKNPAPRLKPGHSEPAKISPRSILVVYGSETGTSEDIAYDIGDTAQRLHFETLVEELDAIQLSTFLRYSLVLFIIPTTGQGDIPQNATALWKKLLRKSLSSTSLARMRFAAFGLGDSSYPKFNWAARKFHKRLLQLGAVEFHPYGEADERHADGIDGLFMQWSSELFKHIQTSFPLPDGLSPIPVDQPLPPRYLVRLQPTTKSTHHTASNQNPPLPEALLPAPESLEQPSPPPSIATLPSTATESLKEDTHKGDLSVLKVSLTEAGGTEVDRLTGKTSTLPSSALGDKTLDNPKDSLSVGAADAVSLGPAGLPLPIPAGLFATVVGNVRMTAEDHWQDVRLFTLDIHETSESSGRCPQPGDTVVLYPKNTVENADKAIRLMGWEAIADTPIDWAALPQRPKNLYVNETLGWTIRDLLINNIELVEVPKRSFLRNISFFSDDPMHKERLIEFTMLDYTDEYYDYATRPRRTILEVLEEFNSVKIPFERILDVFPIIRGREFSVANDARDTSRTELAIALVEYKTILRKARKGLCSTYITSLPIGTTIPISIKRTKFDIFGQENARRPLLAIATGTGVAPVRALIQDRTTWPDVGETHLFFGCRQKEKDFHFRDEWAQLATKSKLHVHPAFSREDRHYVQQKIAIESKIVSKMAADDDTIVIICGGSSKMAEAVAEAIRTTLVDNGIEVDDGAARRRCERLTWIQEIW